MQHTTAFAKGQITFEVFGAPNAPWLVACHGMGLDRENMRPLADKLARDWRVLLWDMPGHGDSTSINEFGIEPFVDALEVVLTAAGVTDPVLLGFSFGGVVAQYALAREKRHCRALIAYGCFAPFHQPAPLAKAMIGAAVAAYRLQSWMRIRRNFALACAITANGQADVAHAVSRCSKKVFIDMARALLSSFQFQPALRFDCPLLIIRGAEDSNRVLLAQAAAALKAAHPDAVERIVRAAGHCVHTDQLEGITDVINEFLHGLPAPVCRYNAIG